MKDTGAKEAHEAASKDPNVVLIDVRSVGEYQDGHPAGSLNIPIMNKGMMGMSPNQDFLAVVTACVPKDKKVLLSCMSGNRSGRAGMILEQNGWKDVTNVRSGWGGVRDMGGNVTEPGWLALGLPTEKGDQAGRSYADLQKKAK
ncbi:MAG: rhodanese-like domain-containing protein [Planctomycetota bacterium]